MENIKTYSGEQILLSSGRLVFNSRSDSIFLSSRQYINLTAAEKVTIDVGSVDSDNEENMFLVNAPRVQLGLDKNGSAEPIVKGEQLDEILSEMMLAVADYSDMVAALAAVPPLLVIPSNFLKGKFQDIKNRIDDFKSPTSFTI